MSKVWRCTTEVVVYMLSDKEPSAFEIEDACSDEIRDNGMLGASTGTCVPITSIATVDADWRGSILRGENPNELTPEDVLMVSP